MDIADPTSGKERPTTKTALIITTKTPSWTFLLLKTTVLCVLPIFAVDRHSDDRKSYYRMRMQVLKTIVAAIFLASPYVAALVAMYQLNYTWMSTFNNVYTQFQRVSSLSGLFEKSSLYTSMMYINRSPAYASKALTVMMELQLYAESVKENYLKYIDILDPQTRKALFVLTEYNICAYLEVIKRLGANYMMLSASDCGTLLYGWGKEGLYAYIIFGMKVAADNALDFVLHGSNLSCQPNTGEFLDYYYHAAYIVKPSLEYAIWAMKSLVLQKSDDWAAQRNWLTYSLIVYLILFVFSMILWIFYLRDKHKHYVSFYTILPKRIREKSSALKQHVKELISAAD